MTIELSTICESIAGLNYSGVKVLDLSEVSEGIGPRDCPVLFPKDPDFLTDFTMVRKSFQTGLGSKYETHYDLHYLLLYAPAGSDRGIANYEKAVNKAMEIVDVIQKATTDIDGSTSVKVRQPLNFSTIQDPNGNAYLGCEIVIQVLDIQELA